MKKHKNGSEKGYILALTAIYMAVISLLVSALFAYALSPVSSAKAQKNWYAEREKTVEKAE